ncbi:mannosyl phosphorylinositol ceramide synthase [Anaeramoeba flamelloides]|uniref:Mannosyl phosphorylinositol ceramide synthase n=1 Tax=Anaeramoeba flamelloides TaxID=1746091 RepID=A0ABQ8Y0G0_9EUKA|nr:mannosyl phosphorylinositol ceramide synthase [Anaeramoeba flamelloides]
MRNLQSLATRVLSYKVNFLLFLFVCLFFLSILYLKNRPSQIRGDTTKDNDISDPKLGAEFKKIFNSVDKQKIAAIKRLTDRLNTDNSQKIENLLYEINYSSFDPHDRYIDPKELFPTNKEIKFEIPKIIFQIYNDKSKIPQKVYDNIAKYAPGYKHVIFDNSETIEFLEKHFSGGVAKLYSRYRLPAHKANLFKFAYLYVNGGVYLGIQTELIESIDQTLGQNSFLAGISISGGQFLKDFTATYAKNELFYDLVQHMVQAELPIRDYLHFTKIFYRKTYCLVEDTNIKKGVNGNKEFPKSPFYFFQEKCTADPNDCYDGLDQYGKCCYLLDENDQRRVKVRYADYPWK